MNEETENINFGVCFRQIVGLHNKQTLRLLVFESCQIPTVEEGTVRKGTWFLRRYQKWWDAG